MISLHQSSLLANKPENEVLIYLFIYVMPKQFIEKYIVLFVGSQVTFWKVIILFFEEINPRSLDLGYVQNIGFKKMLSILKKLPRLLLQFELNFLVASYWNFFITKSSTAKQYVQCKGKSEYFFVFLDT